MHPSPEVARFVDRYWVVTWGLTGRRPYVHRVFAHPVVNVVPGDGRPSVVGVTTQISSRTLRDAGRVRRQRQAHLTAPSATVGMPPDRCARTGGLGR